MLVPSVESVSSVMSTFAVQAATTSDVKLAARICLRMASARFAAPMPHVIAPAKPLDAHHRFRVVHRAARLAHRDPVRPVRDRTLPATRGGRVLWPGL